MYPFDNTVDAVSGKVERSLTGLTTPIALMLPITSAIDRRKSVPQLQFNRMYIFSPYLNFQHISKSSYFYMVRLYKGVSFDS